ncbi:MAG: hypothetical protein EA359_18510 [Balneolaceae bacterium]|nr:MAG: hypothetical protein EA359_18510 [Balneolaceae bacterium]
MDKPEYIKLKSSNDLPELDETQFTNLILSFIIKISRAKLFTFALFFIYLNIVSCSDSASDGDNGPKIGNLEIQVAVSGGDDDPDPFMVLVQGSGSKEIGPNNSVTFPGIGPGTRTIELTNISSHCNVIGNNPRQVNVAADESFTTEIIEVQCKAILRNSVIFFRDVPGGIQIYRSHQSGAAAAPVSNLIINRTGLLTNTPVVSPDGLKIAYCNQGSGYTRTQIYVMDADGSNVVNLTQNNNMTFRTPAWSPDGSKLVFSGNGNIHVMNANGTGITTLTNNNSVSDFWPSWSPNGDKIIFERTFSDNTIDLYVINPDGTGEEVFLEDRDMNYFNPRWSPDGGKIVFVGQLADRDAIRTQQLYTINSNGSNLTNISQESGPETMNRRGPAWSPSGDRIIFHGSGAVNTLYTVNSNGLFFTAFFSSSMSAWNPHWSPIIRN